MKRAKLLRTWERLCESKQQHGQPDKRRRRRCLGSDLHRDELPADPVFCRLFADLQLATTARRELPENTAIAEEVEEQAWTFLLDYCLTLQRPNVPSFNQLPLVLPRH
jgi:hypothetical protein